MMKETNTRVIPAVEKKKTAGWLTWIGAIFSIGLLAVVMLTPDHMASSGQNAPSAALDPSSTAEPALPVDDAASAGEYPAVQSVGGETIHARWVFNDDDRVRVERVDGEMLEIAWSQLTPDSQSRLHESAAAEKKKRITPGTWLTLPTVTEYELTKKFGRGKKEGLFVKTWRAKGYQVSRHRPNKAAPEAYMVVFQGKTGPQSMAEAAVWFGFDGHVSGVTEAHGDLEVSACSLPDGSEWKLCASKSREGRYFQVKFQLVKPGQLTAAF